MQRERSTKITVRENYPVSISSSMYGANLNVLAFNMDYIGRINPWLATQVVDLFKQAKKLRRKDDNG